MATFYNFALFEWKGVLFQFTDHVHSIIMSNFLNIVLTLSYHIIGSFNSWRNFLSG